MNRLEPDFDLSFSFRIDTTTKEENLSILRFKSSENGEKKRKIYLSGGRERPRGEEDFGGKVFTATFPSYFAVGHSKLLSLHRRERERESIMN